jgi:hypothetical protein
VKYGCNGSLNELSSGCYITIRRQTMTSKQQIFAGLMVIFLSLGIPITIAAIFGHFAHY